MGPFHWATVSAVKIACSPFRSGRKSVICMGERTGTVSSKQALSDRGRTLRKGSCLYKHRWDAAVMLTSSEETGTKVKEKDVFVFELANDDVV